MSAVAAGTSASNTALQQVSKTFSGSNTTVSTAIFGITGTVRILKLWGVVTTALGNNHTAAYWRLNDQAAQLDITLNTGTALSSAAAGSTIIKAGLAAAALTLKSNAAGALLEPATAGGNEFSPFTMVKKTAAATNIEYVYTTTNTPTTGVIQFFCEFMPLSADGAVAAM